MAAILIELRSATVHRDRQRVLGPLDLRIPEGSFVGVVGANGAGKTMLLRALAGLTHLSNGERCIDRNVLASRGSIGYLSQGEAGRRDVPFTVEDVVLLGRTSAAGLGHRITRDDKSAAYAVLRRMEIDALRRRLYRELSGGERRKVELARLVAQEAPLLLLDEPGSGLDLDWQERLTDLVAELHQKLERTLVMVTHDVPQLPACCSFALLLKNGMPLAMGAPRDVLTSENFSRLYECEVEVLARDGRFFPLRKAGRL